MGHAMGGWTTAVAVITTVDRNGRPQLRRPRRRPLRRATANYGHHQLPAVPGALAHLDCTLDRHIDAPLFCHRGDAFPVGPSYVTTTRHATIRRWWER